MDFRRWLAHEEISNVVSALAARASPRGERRRHTTVIVGWFAPAVKPDCFLGPAGVKCRAIAETWRQEVDSVEREVRLVKWG